ncbi:hypothetical protein [Nocardia sp. NPDC058497]|uniref:hypothetical protein n=1 Tax=Nocardia sp. NPDC058497 TaxID=3346529 RepID=UPI003648F1F2
MTTIRIQLAAGLVTLVPQSATGGPLSATRALTAPTVLDDAPGLDVLVLEVTGGHLSWNLFAEQSLPAAVLDDPESAQDWLWAVYGEVAALAVADTTLANTATALADTTSTDPHTTLAHADADADAELARAHADADPDVDTALAVADADADAARQHTLSAVPAQPALVNALRRLAYAHWAARWWPASTVDGIPALDPDLLAAEITELTDACDTALDGADAEPFTRPDSQIRFDLPPGSSSAAAHEPLDTRSGADQGTTTAADDDHLLNKSRGRADEYALAAGGSTPDGGGLIIARGSGEWDWRRCPPGILDAGGNAVSWQVARTAEISTVQVSVVAAPDCRGLVPEHLRPYVRVRSAQPAPTDQAGVSPSAGVEFTTPLYLRGDAWTGSVQIPGPPETLPEITIFVPGVGPADPPHEESDVRAQLRRFARLRLTEHTGDSLLTAEAAAAGTDEDF